MRRALVVIGLLVASLTPTTSNVAAQPIPGTTCNLFPSDSIFNTDVSSLPVDKNSNLWKNYMTQNTYLHPDLGTVAQQYGMPVNIAPPPATGVTPTFTFASESDHPTEGYPINQNTLIEGGPSAPSGSDRHAVVVNSGSCKLYEIYNLQNFTNGQTPSAGSGAVWDLTSNAMRPDGWTSADAAGLPITPLLLRPDEILAGSIAHAIRFTAQCTNSVYIWPASHQAGSCGSTNPPMGARFRLRSSFDILGFSANTQVVLRAFQHYGLILADNGADWFFQGTTDDWWGTTAGAQVVSELKTIPAAQFDAVFEARLQVAAGSYQAIPPTPCTSAALSANPPVSQPAGTTVTWTGFSAGCPHPLYRFWELDPGSRWSMVQDYGTSNTFTWHSPLVTGTYQFEVDVRDTTSLQAYDQVANARYTLTSGSACTGVILGTSPPSPGGTGVAVTMTASSTGGCANPVYRFWVKDPGRSWSIVQNYGTSNTHLWAQTGAAGTYALEVDVRDASETTAYDAVFNASYIASPCSGASISASPSSPQAHGTTITLTGSGTCLGTPTYRFWVRPSGGVWQIARDYSTSSTFAWTPATAGTYYLEVDVRDQGATATYETVSNSTDTVT